MTAELSSPDRLDREVFLIDIPFETYNKPIPEITSEIVSYIPHRILNLVKFCGTNSGKNYIIFTVQNKANRDDILNHGPIPLFENPTQTRKPFRKNNNSNTFEQYHQSSQITRSHPPLQNPWQNPSPLAHNYVTNPMTDPSNWPNLPQGTPLPWGNESNSANNSNRPSPSLTAGQIPPNTSSQGQFKPPIITNNFEMDFYIQASAVICKMLNEGMENPEEFICNLNEIYSLQGHPFIDVPNSQLMASKIKFLRKSATPPPSLSSITPPTPTTTTSSSPPSQSPTLTHPPASNNTSSNSTIISASSSTTPSVISHSPSTSLQAQTPSSNIIRTPRRQIYSVPLNSSPQHAHLTLDLLPHTPVPTEIKNELANYPHYIISKQTSDSTVITFSKVQITNSSIPIKPHDID